MYVHALNICYATDPAYSIDQSDFIVCGKEENVTEFVLYMVVSKSCHDVLNQPIFLYVLQKREWLDAQGNEQKMLEKARALEARSASPKLVRKRQRNHNNLYDKFPTESLFDLLHLLPDFWDSVCILPQSSHFNSIM